MRLSNRVARNMCYTMGAVGCFLTIARAIRYVDGTDELWQTISMAIITASLFVIGSRKRKSPSHDND